MILQFNQSGMLPPICPNSNPTSPAAMAPYSATPVEVVKQFAITQERKDIMLGFLNYRQCLRKAGITDGFQWIDGSFVEDCEKNCGRPPNDIDLVTFAERPTNFTDDNQWQIFVNTNIDIFNPKTTKTLYRCDAYYVDMKLPSRIIVSRTKYWFCLFSHQRISYLWKGMIEIPLQANDQDVFKLLNGGTNNVP